MNPQSRRASPQNRVVANGLPLVANPEVETSGKSNLPHASVLPLDDLPLTQDDDIRLELGGEIKKVSKGWRLEKNSNGYYRWRWQKKDANGDPVTYVNSSGNTGYKRGSKYVPTNEEEEAKRQAGF